MLSPLVLLILDGWGIAPPGPGNAISQAKTPNIDRFAKTFPTTQLLAAGEAVGLPKGEDGNTETGHINLGAGQIVFQDLARINHAIADGSFFQNEAFLQAIKHANDFRSNLHIMGLVGSGGVHSSTDHLLALLRFVKSQKFSRLFLHLFTDGRDSPPTSAKTYVEQIEAEITKIGVGRIATIIGRYYAMDRDKRWQRTQKAYVALTAGKGLDANSAKDAITQAYSNQQTDEFIEPTIILDNVGKPLPRITDNDSIIFFNFRIDRPRQLTKAFILPDFETAKPTREGFDPYAIKYHQKHQPEAQSSIKHFAREVKLQNIFFTTMTEYERGLPVSIAFPPQTITTPLGKVISDNQLNQLRITETEKERFVTYYFNGQREDPFPGEDRIIIPSAKVATYDLKPEMSAHEITAALLERTTLQKYQLFIVNIPNADMVGHTGNLPATIKACEVVDQCVGKIVLNILGLNGTVLITADHGNAEELINLSTGEVDTEHSANPVPLIIASDKYTQKKPTLQTGILADIAPTVLKALSLPIPSEMTGKPLI